MMDLTHWQQGMQVHIPAFEVFLENGFQQSYTIQLKDTATGSIEEAEQEIRQADRVVRFLEKKFYSEVFLGFNEAWLTALVDQLSPATAGQDNIGDELILELSSNLVDMIAGALAEAGIEIEIANMDIITDDKLSRAFNLQQYFRSNLRAEPASKEKDEQTAPALNLWIAASHPNEEMIDEYVKKFSDDNPFANDTYADIAVRFAKHGEMVHDHSNTKYNAGISTKGQQVEFEDFGQSKNVNNMREVRNIDILKDVGMHVSVELGRREMPLGHILQLVKGSVIELEKLAGEPVEILVNGHKIAQGDVVVIDEHFGVRISNLLASQERIKELQ